MSASEPRIFVGVGGPAAPGRKDFVGAIGFERRRFGRGIGLRCGPAQAPAPAVAAVAGGGVPLGGGILGA